MISITNLQTEEASQIMTSTVVIRKQRRKKTTHLIELFKVILGSLGITGY